MNGTTSVNFGECGCCGGCGGCTPPGNVCLLFRAGHFHSNGPDSGPFDCDTPDVTLPGPLTGGATSPDYTIPAVGNYVFDCGPAISVHIRCDGDSLVMDVTSSVIVEGVTLTTTGTITATSFQCGPPLLATWAPLDLHYGPDGFGRVAELSIPEVILYEGDCDTGTGDPPDPTPGGECCPGDVLPDALYLRIQFFDCALGTRDYTLNRNVVNQCSGASPDAWVADMDSDVTTATGWLVAEFDHTIIGGQWKCQFVFFEGTVASPGACIGHAITYINPVDVVACSGGSGQLFTGMIFLIDEGTCAGAGGALVTIWRVPPP